MAFKFQSGILSAFKLNRDGNFAVLAALIIPVGLGAAGLSMDMASILAAKSKLQATADAAAVAAAAALVNNGATVDQAKQLALDFVKGQMSSELAAIADAQAADPNGVFGKFNMGDCTSVDIKQTADARKANSYNVVVKTCLDVELLAMGALSGNKSEMVQVSSSTESTAASKTALSMYLVLDRSGSMGWDTSTVVGTSTYTYSCGGRQTCTGTQPVYMKKIDALKAAAGKLLTQINTADPQATYSRLGAVSYDYHMNTPLAISWGTSAVSKYVNALTAEGATDSSEAFKQAYQSLASSTENTAHQQKSGQVPDKYIVFMTDGENNFPGANTETKKLCDGAKSAGMEVYTIAFMAPDAGKELLRYCATDANHFFPAEDADQILAAFQTIGEKATKVTARLTQ
jgi:Flp pilus assembly protein TadG